VRECVFESSMHSAPPTHGLKRCYQVDAA